MRLLLSRRDFALAWLGSLISLAGDWMLSAALPVYVYQLTGSAMATGLMFAVHVLPYLLLGSVAGVFVDRWDRKRALVIANVVHAIGLIPLLLVSSAEQLWLIYVVQLTQAVIAQVVRPAKGALLPRLVPEDELPAANSLNALNGNLSRLVGPAVGGLMIATTGLWSVTVADAITFAAAAVSIEMIRADTRPPVRTAESAEHALAAFLRDWLDGLRVVRHDRTLTILFAFVAISSVGEGVMAATFVPFVNRVLEGGESAFGAIVSAQAIGGLIGSAWLAARPNLLPPAVRLVGVGALGLASIDLLTFNYHPFVSGIVPALVFMAIVGIPITGMVVGLTTLQQVCTSDAYRGRVLGAYVTTSSLFTLAGSMLGGFVGDRFDLVMVLNVQSLGYGVAGLLVLALLGAEVGAARVARAEASSAGVA